MFTLLITFPKMTLVNCDYMVNSGSNALFIHWSSFSLSKKQQYCQDEVLSPLAPPKMQYYFALPAIQMSYPSLSIHHLPILRFHSSSRLHMLMMATSLISSSCSNIILLSLQAHNHLEALGDFVYKRALEGSLSAQTTVLSNEHIAFLTHSLSLSFLISRALFKYPSSTLNGRPEVKLCAHAHLCLL